jgi:asparaginyl-tRNA synthetase
MATSTLTAPAKTAVAPKNRNLSTDPKRMAVIKVWDSMMRGARKYCEEQGFVTIHNMPHIVGVTGACENTDTLFTVDWYDGKKMFLPQSNQLYIEMLTQAIEGGRVCGEIQSFRKEAKADGRRLAQFTLFEIEHIGDLDELLGHLAGIVHSAAREVAIKCAKELEMFGRNPQDIIDLTFKRKTYEEAIELLKPNGFPDLQFGDDRARPRKTASPSWKVPSSSRTTPRKLSSSTCATTTRTPAW